MKKLFSLCILCSLPIILKAEYRLWQDTQGHKVNAEFVRISGEQVHLRRQDTGQIIAVSIVVLSPQDQEYLKQKASGSKTVIIGESIRKIDAAVEAGLQKHNLKYNESLNEYMFVRRIYADLAGRIPTYKELTGYLNSRHPTKRQILVSQLLNSEDYVSHNFNFFGDLLRIQSKVPGTFLRTDAFIYWLKDQIRKKKPFDDLVEEMVTAEGRIWDNPAVGYHLRDNGMKLDHVSYMTKIFLGTDISCAQCHDDPFQDWTQVEYYELSAFLADLDTQQSLKPSRQAMKRNPELVNYALNRKKVSDFFIERDNLDLEKRADQDKLRRQVRLANKWYNEMLNATQLKVYSKPNQPMRLPDDYQYDDAKPKQVIPPRFIFLEEEPAKDSRIPDRKRLATWLVSERNPRFSESIANRMWHKFFGRGVAEPLHNYIEEDAYNPELLEVLGQVMRDLDFDLRAFSRVIVGTKAYNTLATRTLQSEADPYYFPGPVLRRMSAEQAWDSLLTLMLNDPLEWKAGKGDEYNKIINLIAAGPPKEIPDVLKRNQQYRAYLPTSNLFNDKGVSYTAAMKQPIKRVVQQKKTPSKSTSAKTKTGNASLAAKINPPKQNMEMMMDNSMSMMMKSAGRNRLVLARASELEQPAPVGHFLRKFGQSERNFVVGAASVEGSVPQVMELMNGAATMVLTQPNSLLFQNLKKKKDPMERAEVVFLSILNRRMLPVERKMLVKELESGGDAAISNLIWALLNTPEFLFVK